MTCIHAHTYMFKHIYIHFNFTTLHIYYTYIYIHTYNIYLHTYNNTCIQYTIHIYIYIHINVPFLHATVLSHGSIATTTQTITTPLSEIT